MSLIGTQTEGGDNSNSAGPSATKATSSSSSSSSGNPSDPAPATAPDTEIQEWNISSPEYSLSEGTIAEKKYQEEKEARIEQLKEEERKREEERPWCTATVWGDNIQDRAIVRDNVLMCWPKRSIVEEIKSLAQVFERRTDGTPDNTNVNRPDRAIKLY